MAAVTAAIAIGLAVAGGFAAAESAKDEAGFIKDVNLQRAAQAQKGAQESARDFRRQQSAKAAQSRAATGGSGIDPGTGSALLARADFDAEVELQALRIIEGGDIKATRLAQESRLAKKRATAIGRQALFGAGSLLLNAKTAGVFG